MTEYALKRLQEGLWPGITEAEVRKIMLNQMIFDLSVYNLAGFEDIVREMIEKHCQFKNG